MKVMEKLGYRSLIVWQKAMLLVRLVYAEVKKFPNDERYALVIKFVGQLSLFPQTLQKVTEELRTRTMLTFLQ